MSPKSIKPDQSKPPKPRKLKPVQLKAMDLILTGMPLQEVAEQLGVSRQTISEWKNHHPEFKERLEALCDEAEEDLRYSVPMNDAFMLSALRNLATEGPHESRLKAVQFYFDRFGLKRGDYEQDAARREEDALLMRVVAQRHEFRPPSPERDA